MRFTDRGELQSASPSFRDQFLKDWHWLPTEDTCIDIYVQESDFTWPKELKSKHELPDYWAEEAKTYIRTITQVYPFQMRHYLGEPMWSRFCDVFAATGDLQKAMRAI